MSLIRIFSGGFLIVWNADRLISVFGPVYDALLGIFGSQRLQRTDLSQGAQAPSHSTLCWLPDFWGWSLPSGSNARSRPFSAGQLIVGRPSRSAAFRSSVPTSRPAYARGWASVTDRPCYGGMYHHFDTPLPFCATRLRDKRHLPAHILYVRYRT
jgi:hypothetical protein